MNVLLVSQCDKRALTETRRILDQFAERRGKRTWQTPITQAGLDTLRKLLRKTARKNTAVACHWIRGQDHSELMWIVGDARRFNTEGAVPTNTTTSDVLRKGDENDWHSAQDIRLLAQLAALLHDLGKASVAFQQRLQGKLEERNRYRHEWVSLRLFLAFVGKDDDAGWLARMTSEHEGSEAEWTSSGRYLRDGLDEGIVPYPFRSLATQAPLAAAIGWLIVTHHRLPLIPVSKDDGSQAWLGKRAGRFEQTWLDAPLAGVACDWNEIDQHSTPAHAGPYWQLAGELPAVLSPWRTQARRVAKALLELKSRRNADWLGNPYVMHLARLCLMLADHHYSSITDEVRRQPYRNAGYPLYANTSKNDSWKRLSDKRQRPIFNQTLDEHLLGVQAHATLVARSLPTLARSLPALQNHKGLKKRNTNARFQWQDKAADLAASVRHRAASQGAFIVNMASTGCGKTLGNARIMNALADPATGLRCAFAIGLRTLTLQTGRVFQNDLGLSDDQLAIQVGGTASRALFEYWEQQAEASGSASSQALFDEGGQVLFEGNDQHPLLQRLTDDARVRALIAAPLLVCTVDHLTPATESLRGGRQIAPMLRLMTGDLVLDEPDDFDMADLPALTRLVHWAGLLGSRVLLSSATLPPALVEGLFLAYRAGRAVFQQHRSDRPGEPVNVCCLWIDEFDLTVQDCPDGASFRASHEGYVHKRVKQLAKTEVRRLAQIALLPETWSGMATVERRSDFARFVLERAWHLHQQSQNHSIDPISGKRVSLGLIRMANISPLFDVALAMYAQGVLAPGMRVHLCVYHSQFPLLARSAIERQLDTVLNRRPAADGADPVFQQPAIRRLIDASPEQDQLFIVLGSPVTEVGRDHDYDWAVVEPSSMRSLIQLAGRVRRHRPGAVDGVNLLVLDSNLRAYEHPGRAAYCKPGFEMDKVCDKADTARHFHLHTHQLQTLLAKHTQGASLWPVDARARIAVAKANFHPGKHLVDLEHARMHDAMLPRDVTSADTTPVARAASLHWASGERLWLTGLLPQFQRFRHDPLPRVDVAFLPDDEEERLLLHRVADGERRGEKLYVPVEQSLLHRCPLAPMARAGVTPWAQVDLLEELAALAQGKGLLLPDCAARYATASLPDAEQGWWFHEALGFSVCR